MKEVKKTITVYEGYDGRLFDTIEECETADKAYAYEIIKGIQRICSMHGTNCDGCPFRVRKDTFVACGVHNMSILPAPEGWIKKDFFSL